VSVPETARFGERLRYLICTSQLLEEKPVPTQYRAIPTKDDSDILDLVPRKRTLRYWIGTGGCVIVVALLVSWSLRCDPRKVTKARTLAVLGVGLLVALYLYAYTVPCLKSGLI
jgi:vezatin